MIKKKLRIVTYALVAVIIIAVAAIAVIYLGKQKLNDYSAQIDELSSEISTNQQTVYVATSDIEAGDKIIDGENVQAQQIMSGLDSSLYMTEDQMGMVALVDIPTGSAVYADALGQDNISNDSRVYEVNVVNLTSTQKTNDIVDIRILFPDGTDYIVFSKMKIRNLSGTTFDLYLDENQILTLDSAVVDAYIHNAKIYTTKYIQPQLQDESTPFYPVRSEILDLINSDPNILEVAKETLNAEARQDLEDRMAAASDEDGTSTSSSATFDPNGTLSVTGPSADDAADEYSEDTDVEDETDDTTDTTDTADTTIDTTTDTTDAAADASTEAAVTE